MTYRPATNIRRKSLSRLSRPELLALQRELDTTDELDDLSLRQTTRCLVRRRILDRAFSAPHRNRQLLDY
jgi:hypothetical protein